MADFVHVVMTRFNLATPGREASFRTQPDWLATRFDLFERYCLPGMAAQTEQDFAWMIFFDDQTPQAFKDRIEELRRIRPFIPFYTPLFPGDGWRDAVFARIEARPPALLTTNLDNDDSLAVDFVARLQAAARAHLGGPACALNFTNGFVLSGERLYAHAHRSNAFTNLLEPFDTTARTAPAIPHMELARHLPVHQLDGPGAWLQVVHGGNVSNKIRGRRISCAEANGRFAPAAIAQMRDPGMAETVAERLVGEPLRQARDGAIALARRLRGR
ncbi:hypothetical protein GVO57_03810 [Sphingomonas changnyeongensis]|uniref:Rhamnosyl transferase n=1 Tax=Sphingomonas changnyeongensis TaxID=2698679 RepID=A0A7Z2S594_9SPHN|nr:glycosyltransferase [Sphingomonas changnyeongensis]QHL90118.1 hypothetical protein GVO57_03810 [Sphingomonas changnyeongensis]